MFKSYFLIALRKLSRERGYVFINILSLSLGLASFLILFLYLRSELTYDRHNIHHAQIYRAVSHYKSVFADADDFATTPNGLGPIFSQDYPQIGQFVRFAPARQNVIKYQDIEAQWTDAFMADPGVFDVFTHDILFGDPAHAFDEPYSVALSETAARRYFGNENPVGRTIESAGTPFAVRLVFKDLPENSHLRYDVLYPMSLQEVLNPQFIKNYETGLWNVGTFFTYFKVRPEFGVEEFPRLMAAFYERHMAAQGEIFKTTYTARLQPLDDVHFGPKMLADRPTGNIFYVYGFTAVALFILVIACINYINLATARAARRAKEVGMRKVLGASQGQLIGQFLGESATFTFLALVFAIALLPVVIVFTPLRGLIGAGELLAAAGQPQVWLVAIGVGVGVALIAGLYPAFYLARISPLAALTHVRRSWQSGFNLRQVLVFVQLSISIGVIAATLLMLNQMRYVRDLPLGFDKGNRLIVTLRGYDVINNSQTLFNEIRRLPNVLNVSAVEQVPGTGSYVNLMNLETNAGIIEPIPVARLPVGLEFVDTMKLEIVSGRGFSRDIATDLLESALVSESLVKKMGWDDPLGKRIVFGPARTVRVIGVVKDFHYASLHNPVGPLVLYPLNENFSNVALVQRPLMTSTMIVAMTGEDLAATVRGIQETVARFDRGFQAAPAFLDDRLAGLYESESTLMALTGAFAGICVVIAIMGLFGLTAYTTEQRTREIGVRRVLGASDGEIVTMLSRYLLPVVVAAGVPAAIVVWWAMNRWLQRFAYHEAVSAVPILGATAVVLAIAFATIFLQGYKAVRGNVVDTLRTD